MIKLLLFFIGLTFISQNALAQQKDTKIDSSFTLSYRSIGIGSNMWTMQPMFKVKASRFVYTLEDTWYRPHKKPKVKTLLTGEFRTSSIDSIINISTETKGDSIYKLNAGIMSGGIIKLDISSKQRKLNFDLRNAQDTTAEKIVDILNRYIPDKYRKLWISDTKPEIIKIR